ncbi:MAG: hypothetical protein KF900_07835 [Bacteroidetes bacterium]|nr:hypothetical protein [Bacteroidota bacterium]
MKKIIFALLIVAATFSACNKKRNKTITVVRDCTGTYLNWDGKDYKVCNFEFLKGVSVGAEVKGTFTKIKECSRYDTIPVCYMAHPFESWIEVEKIKSSSR